MSKVFWGIDATRFGWVMTGIGGRTDVIRFHQELHSLLNENYTRRDKLQNISEEYPEDSMGNRMGIWL